jgi:hypothetical protein
MHPETHEDFQAIQGSLINATVLIVLILLSRPKRIPWEKARTQNKEKKGPSAKNREILLPELISNLLIGIIQCLPLDLVFLATNLKSC